MTVGGARGDLRGAVVAAGHEHGRRGPATEAPVVQQATAAAPPTLSPMLLVAALVTGIAVLCLLLPGSRRE
ncbi:hypothetical protein [Amycolatopsis sp. NPDC098790]|uniref:hypothetical protein n=1 Tax=Amycolatopsis sp. NPDC098790 TaxID=3363939 RepID=UPI0037F1D455